MILRFYPTKDTTIYEQYPQKNTGLDAILEISKTIVGTGSYNSRTLLDFDYTAISQSISSLGYNAKLFSYSLKLYVAEANEIPSDYTLYCFPVSSSWSMGVGRYGNYPETTTGVSWTYKTTADDLTSAWQTASFAANATASWATRPGGGTWYTGSVASQSFSYTTSDVDMDVTSIIRQVQSGSIDFKGFILKKSLTDESSANIFNSLKFFSKDTHTVYLPVLEARFDDSITTGSLSLINPDEEINIIPVNLKHAYTETSTPVIRISARYKFPVDTFETASGYLTRYRLPAGTQYAVYSAQSDDVVIDFSDYTKLSADATSNYIKMHLDSFQPERYYKLLFKVPNSGSASAYQIYDNKWIFKVTRG
jgi:hypothetical protein